MYMYMYNMSCTVVLKERAPTALFCVRFAMDEKPPETVLEPSPETVRVLEGATQAAQAAKDALLQAQAQHESALEQLQAETEKGKKADRAAEAALRESAASSESALEDARRAHQHATAAFAGAKRAADAERHKAFNRIQSERLLHELALCTRAYQDGSEEARRALDAARLEAALALKRERSASKVRRPWQTKAAPAAVAVPQVSEAQAALKARLALEYTRISALFRQWDVDGDRASKCP